MSEQNTEKSIEAKRHISVSVSTLSEARESVERTISTLALDNATENLANLLFEEVTLLFEENLPKEANVDIRIKKRSDRLSIQLSVPSDRDLLSRKSHSQEEKHDEVESAIRHTILEKNEDRIRSNYRNGRQRVTILLGKRRAKRNYEEELEEFYEAYKGAPPSASRQMFFIIKQHFWGFVLSKIIKLCRTSPMLIIPIVTANIIDIVSTTGISANLTKFYLNLAAAAISLLLNILFAYLECITFRNICFSIGVDLRNLMVRKLQLFSLSYHSDTKVGTLANKMLASVEAIGNAIEMLVGDLSIIFAYCLVAILLTLKNCPVMALFYIFFIPLAVIITVIFRRPISRLNQEYRKEMEETNAVVTEMLGMVEMTRAHGLQKNEMKRMGEYVQELHHSELKLNIINQVFGAISWVSLQLFQLLALAFSAYLATKGMITIGMIALFQSYFTIMVNRLSTFINAIPNIAKGLEGFNSISEVLCADAEEQNGNNKLSSVKGEIEFANIDFSYKDSKTKLFEDFSLEIPARSSVAFVGGSGSGKTTLINMLIGFIHPKKGEVRIDGQSISSLDLALYRKRIAVVPQHTVLFSGTLLENLTYGSPYVSTAQVWELLEEVGLDDFVRKLPEGLNTRISESGSKLSGGQRQRIAIVRALLRDARILILDEATSALDNSNEKLIGDVLERIKGSCTIVMIAHRPSTIRNVDNIVVLDKGKIVEQGRFDELMERQGEFTRLFENAEEELK